MKSSSPRILCVEDDLSTCEMLTFALGRLGFEVVSVHTFADATQKALSGSFDLFIVDGRLPDGNGVDLCKQIRERDGSTPILFTSGDSYSSQNKDAIEAGAQAYFVKPVNLEDVKRTVQELLSS